MFRTKRTPGYIAFLALLSGCGYVDPYEEAVYDHEPIYCYQSLASVECSKEPNHREKRRLVNYYGPHPSRFDEEEPTELPELKAPEKIEYWVKDPEPIPHPAVNKIVSQ